MDKQTVGRLSENLKRAREEAGLTQEQAAGALGVSLTTVQNWETQSVRKPPRLSRIGQIASVYGKSADWFFKDAGNATQAQPDQARPATKADVTELRQVMLEELHTLRLLLQEHLPPR